MDIFRFPFLPCFKPKRKDIEFELVVKDAPMDDAMKAIKRIGDEYPHAPIRVEIRFNT